MSADEMCSVTLSDYYTTVRCGRPVKADGMCGIHLAARNRREKNANKRAEANAELEAVRERVAACVPDEARSWTHRKEYGDKRIVVEVDPEWLIGVLIGSGIEQVTP